VLTEIAPGMSVSDVANRTGWAVSPETEVSERAPLSEAETFALAELRAASERNRRH
jgi:hypothetical protein